MAHTSTARRTRKGVLALLLSMGLVAAACGDDDESGSEAEATSTSAAGGGASSSTSAAPAEEDELCTAEHTGGSLTVGTPAAPSTLDPYFGGGGNVLSGYDQLPIYSMLMRYDQDTASYVPLVAKAMTSNADASVWTVELRPEVKFGNGDPLDADALIAHFNRHLSPESKSQIKQSAGQDIASYRKVDPWKVEITLKGPYGQFPSSLTLGLGMVQNTKVVAAMGAEAFAKNPVGAGVGAFEISRWAVGEETVLKAKTNWWGGPVCLDELRIVSIPGARATFDAFKQGEVDLFAFNRDPQTEQEIRAEADNVVDTLNHGAGMVFFNHGVKGYTGPVSDVRVRKAIAYAIDADTISKRAFSGGVVPQKGLISSAAIAIKPTTGLPYDPAKAKALLDEYKAETGWDGSLPGLCASTPPPNLESGITIEGMLEAVGFKIDLQQVTVTQIINAVYLEQNFEMVPCFGVINPELLLYGSYRQFDSRNPANPVGYKNPKLDIALDHLRGALDVKAYQAALEEMQVVWNDDVPTVPLFATRDGTAFRDGIHGIEWQTGFTPILERAWVE